MKTYIFRYVTNDFKHFYEKYHKLIFMWSLSAESSETWRTVESLMKENTEYLELFIIVDDTKFQQGQENLIFFQIFDILYQNIIIIKFS